MRSDARKAAQERARSATDEERLAEVLARVERENRVNCTGLGEVGCTGREGWHSWHEHRKHVAEEQARVILDAGYVPGEAVERAKAEARVQGLCANDLAAALDPEEPHRATGDDR